MLFFAIFHKHTFLKIYFISQKHKISFKKSINFNKALLQMVHQITSLTFNEQTIIFCSLWSITSFFKGYFSLLHNLNRKKRFLLLLIFYSKFELSRWRHDHNAVLRLKNRFCEKIYFWSSCMIFGFYR